MPRGSHPGPAHASSPDLRFARWPRPAVSIVAIAFAGLLSSCAKPIPNSPALNRGVAGGSEADERWATTVLDASQRDEVEGVFRSLPGDLTSAQVGPGPAPAPRGRWNDIPAAAGRAASKAEVAILSTTFEPEGSSLESADRIVFSIVTLTSEPGRLEVSRGGDGAIYRATATIGLLDERTETVERLLAELAREVAAFGRKPELAPIAE